jgi:hypothetical protein
MRIWTISSKDEKVSLPSAAVHWSDYDKPTAPVARYPKPIAISAPNLSIPFAEYKSARLVPAMKRVRHEALAAAKQLTETISNIAIA